MAVGLSNYLCNSFLNALGNNTSYAVTLVYIKLHVGDPGAAATANAATETTRKSVSFAAASGGAIASDADISWTNIAGSQDATHFTAWDNLTAGNFLFSGTITANAYTAGDTYTIASGNLSASLTVAS
ncbi:phage tail fiber protein [Streptococcus uberis]